ncbi:MAG: hypothetical protein VX519_10105, partial [Myxococcota bacterium]|nr:hypothetical protein [Myxococcota bacterium]
DDQLSKAIGRRGQNVRLAAQLTGWRIDIYSESRHTELNDQAGSELGRVEGVDEEMIENLIRHGFRSVKELTDAEPFEVSSILGLDGVGAAETLISAADVVLEQLILEEAEARKSREESALLEAEELPPEAGEVVAAPDSMEELPPEAGEELPVEAAEVETPVAEEEVAGEAESLSVEAPLADDVGELAPVEDGSLELPPEA